jgi:undecaprenyl-diphosphatase
MIATISAWDLFWFGRFFGMPERSLPGRVLPAVSRSADGPLYPLVFLAILMGDPIAAPRLLTAGVVAFALELSLYKWIKSRAKRPRPFAAHAWVERRMDPPDEFSFPSGHTAAAFVMVAILSSWQPWLLPILAFWASLVGVSRVYLGVHYPTDVLAGMTLGGICAAIGLWVAG